MTDDPTLDVWFDALAGRGTVGGAAANEARALREALRARPAIDELGLQRELATSDADRGAQLLGKARGDPILGPILARGRGRLNIARRAWGGLLAAGLAGISIALVWTLRPATEVPVYREAPDQVHRMVAADPRALRDEIARALRAAGIEVVIYERFGREGLDAELPRPVTGPVRSILVLYRIPEPADGVLRIEIESGSSP
ncbi:MAG TPA: hypothetical protein PKL49_09560 [Steroidobacteraceae bacterium]|nr:hypothetical protein [Steroidobacteraceae bacterium]HNS26680.1 hypothetical protein [Steroidobacteraceae bacterium]